MRFLANENFPKSAVDALIAAGDDVVWIREAAPGSSDAAVLTCAARENRILLTFDKDFGELAQGARLPAASGIVLFRLPMPKANEAGRRLAALVGSRRDWAGHFSVVEAGRIRMRPLISNARGDAE